MQKAILSALTLISRFSLRSHSSLSNIPVFLSSGKRKMAAMSDSGFSDTNGFHTNGHNGFTKRGSFIVFEGLDKSGKSSQAKYLVDRLNKDGISAALLKFPTREGPVGELVDKYLRKEINLTDESIHLLFSADRWESQFKLVSLLREGVTVIADRYAYSGIVFTSAKGLDFDWCISSDSGLLAPDRVLFLNVSTDVALKRQGFGDERYEKVEFQKKVYQQYQRLMEREKTAGTEWRIINADKPEPEVQEAVYREVLNVVQDPSKKTALSILFH